MPTVIYNKGKSKKEFPYNVMGKVQATEFAKMVGGKLKMNPTYQTCLLYTSDAADDLLCVDLGGRRIIKKKK